MILTGERSERGAPDRRDGSLPVAAPSPWKNVFPLSGGRCGYKWASDTGVQERAEELSGMVWIKPKFPVKSCKVVIKGDIFILMRLCNISPQVHLMLCLEKSIAKFPPKQDYITGLSVVNFFPRSLLSHITRLIFGVQYSCSCKLRSCDTNALF